MRWLGPTAPWLSGGVEPAGEIPGKLRDGAWEVSPEAKATKGATAVAAALVVAVATQE